VFVIMTGRIVVFIGPSLSRDAAARHAPDAVFLPPISRGGLEPLLNDPPAAVGIVDGEFYQRLAISPKEILRLLDAGIPVFGSSSMGALRAVELESCGMIGVGAIFEQFRSGALEADDEVAMTFCPETLRPTSEPLVNIRVALRTACASGVLSEAEAATLLDVMRGLYFPERTTGRLMKEAFQRLGAQRATALRRWWANAPDAKAADAIALLVRVTSD
jgi:TfuA protein